MFGFSIVKPPFSFLHTKRQVIIKMNKFNMFITAVCVLFLIKLRWPKNKSIYDIKHVFERDGNKRCSICKRLANKRGL